tara:strand:+ start:298 stop:789 length:492 start_codon:yes stop_codon:yes gene_type:complete
MGFDLYGTKVRDSGAKLDYNNPVEGQYFRANVWFWRPLWNLACEIGEDILTETDIESGQFNDGHHISESKSMALANLFKKMIEKGEHHTIVAMLDADKNTLPLEKCSHCDGTGQRDDEYVQGECNGCEGTGEKESFETWYGLHVEGIEEFENFLRHSGGFRIS